MKETLEEKHKRYSEIWQANFDNIYAYCERKMKSCPNDLDDVVSDVFTALWESILKGTEIVDATHWLLGTAYRRICKAYSEHNLRKTKMVSFSSKIENMVVKSEYSIDDERMQPEIIEEIFLMADELLSVKEHELVEMFYDKRMSHEEIAKKLGTTTNGVKQRLYRAKCKLRVYAKQRVKEMGLNE
ncbi:MAG: sigma-70 family RNA polymerase sigma factor [Clostridia bacterium]|nr:sigma-70 family RNA polymerase sigma factor [Clostridia bacterium]